MADISITELTSYSDPKSTDELPIVDLVADVTKRVTLAKLLQNANPGTAAAPGITFDGRAANTGIYSQTDYQVGLATDGVSRVHCRENGYVGINKIFPTAPFDVVGNTAIAGDVDIASGKVYKINGSEVLSATALAGAVKITTTNITDGTIVNADISPSAEIAVSKLADGAARQVLQTDAAGTGVEWTSNVDVPGTLDVTGATTLDSTLTVPLGSAASPTLRFSGDANSGLYSPGADQVAVATNGTGRLFVDASGNVGVGTSSVNALLEVNNSTAGGEVQRIEGNYDGSGSVILTNWRRAGGSVAAALKYNDDSSPLCMSIGTTTSHEFRIRTADTDAITIDTSQRVGIGSTADPGVYNAKLWIDSATDSTFTVNTTGSASLCQVVLRNSNVNGEARILNTTGGPLTFYRSFGNEAARIDTSGRLLVGTPSARSFYNSSGSDARLQIEGDGFSSPGYILQSWVVNHNSATVTPHLAIGKSRGSANGSVTVVQNGDSLGHLDWHGADGTNMVEAASIGASVDGTPGANDMPGRLVFATTADGASSPTERMRITSDAYVRLAAGTGGIQFNGDTAAANALDDYEEGTWTPNLTGSGGGAYTYGGRTGIYTKVGNTVTVHCAFEITGTTTPYSGNLQVDGLPYLCRDVRAVGSMVPGSAITYSAPYTFVFPQAELNSTIFYIVGGNLTSTALGGATISTGNMYGFSLTYKTS